MSWDEFFSSVPNLKLIGLCFASATFSQRSGNPFVSNYLTQIVKEIGINNDTDITIFNGMVTLWRYVRAISVTFLVTCFKRRTFFLVGSGDVLVTSSIFQHISLSTLI